MQVRCDSHSGCVGHSIVSEVGRLWWIEGGWSKSWWGWRGASGARGRSASGDIPDLCPCTET